VYFIIHGEPLWTIPKSKVTKVMKCQRHLRVLRQVQDGTRHQKKKKKSSFSWGREGAGDQVQSRDP
jgi:hypothetical protein